MSDTPETPDFNDYVRGYADGKRDHALPHDIESVPLLYVVAYISFDNVLLNDGSIWEYRYPDGSEIGVEKQWQRIRPPLPWWDR